MQEPYKDYRHQLIHPVTNNLFLLITSNVFKRSNQPQFLVGHIERVKWLFGLPFSLVTLHPLLK